MPGRHDLERVERLHAPLHELVALLVAREFQLHVEVEHVRRAVVVDLHRVVDDEVHRHERLDRSWGSCPCCCATLRIAARSASTGTPVKSCSTMRARMKGISSVRAPVGLPAGELLHVLLGHLLAVHVAQHALQHDADRDRQALHVGEGLRERRQRVVLAGLAGGGLEGLEGVEGVVGHGGVPRLLGRRRLRGRICTSYSRAAVVAAHAAAARRSRSAGRSAGPSRRRHASSAFARAAFGVVHGDEAAAVAPAAPAIAASRRRR